MVQHSNLLPLLMRCPAGATPSLSYELSVAPITLSQAGPYFLTYAVVLGVEATQIQFRHWVYWTNIYTLVNNLLQTNVPTADVDMMFHAVASNFFRKYPILGTYNNLSVNEDKYYLDQGLAYIVAILIRQYKPQMKPTAPLKTIRIQTSEYEFATPPLTHDQIEDWTTQSYFLLYNLSVVRQAVVNRRASTRMFQIAGPSRNQRGIGNYTTIEGITRSLLTDDYSNIYYYYAGPAIWGG